VAEAQSAFERHRLLFDELEAFSNVGRSRAGFG